MAPGRSRHILRTAALFPCLLAVCSAVAAQPWAEPGPYEGHPEVYVRDAYARYKQLRERILQARLERDGLRAGFREISGVGKLQAGQFIGREEADSLVRKTTLDARIIELESQAVAMEREWDQWLRFPFSLGPLTDIEQAVEDRSYNPETGQMETRRTDAIDFRIRYFLEETERQRRTDGLHPQLATVFWAGDGQITAAAPEVLAGGVSGGQRLLAKDGSFPGEGRNAPINVGPVTVGSACTLRCYVKGTPPVPQVWSLSNWNTGLHLYFAPALGRGWGRTDEVLTLGGQTENNELTGEVELPCPGRISVMIHPPFGSAPLGGGDFAQSFTSSVEVVKLRADRRAYGGSEVRNGDVITSGAVPTALQLRDGTYVHLRPWSSIKLSEPEPGLTRIELQKGSFRVTGWGWNEGSTVEVIARGKVLRPHGTDFAVSDTGDNAVLHVFDGEVEIEIAEGQRATIGAGHQAWVTDGISVETWGMQLDQTLAEESDGQLIRSGPPARLVAQPFGVTTLEVRDGVLPEGWRWEDPRQDATYSAPEPGTFHATVPTDNDLWDLRYGAPCLLRAVTGDFDLEAEAPLPPAASDWTSLDFCVKSPGSCQGLASGQLYHGSAQDYWLLGSCWLWPPAGGFRMTLWDDEHGTPSWPPAPREALRVRLSRRGSTWYAARSVDQGATWHTYAYGTADLPATVWAGWAFRRAATADPLGEFTLRDVRLVSQPLGLGEEPDWHTYTHCGTVEAGEAQARLALDGSGLGLAQCMTSALLPGDFEIAVAFALDHPWGLEPGRSRYFSLGVRTTDGKNQAYIGGAVNAETGVPRYHSDLRLNGLWGRYQWANGLEASGRLRLARHEGVVSSYYWKDDGWQPLGQWTDEFRMPVHLQLAAGNEWFGQTPAALSVVFRAEDVRAGPDYAASTTDP